MWNCDQLIDYKEQSEMLKECFIEKSYKNKLRKEEI